MRLAPRRGPRPRTSQDGPHRQLDQQSPPEDEIHEPGSSLAPEPPAEPVHLHGVTDTSLHLCLPVELASRVCLQGWGEPHGYAQQRTEIMVYGPRDDEELAVVLALVAASLAFARAK